MQTRMRARQRKGGRLSKGGGAWRAADGCIAEMGDKAGNAPPDVFVLVGGGTASLGELVQGRPCQRSSPSERPRWYVRQPTREGLVEQAPSTLVLSRNGRPGVQATILLDDEQGGTATASARRQAEREHLVRHIRGGYAREKADGWKRESGILKTPTTLLPRPTAVAARSTA